MVPRCGTWLTPRGEPLRDEIQTRVDARVRTLASDCAALS
jgi:hypothetical protein